MPIQIEKDSEGNSYFRIVRIPLGAGTSTTVRVVDLDADEVAGQIMDIDLGSSIEAVNASGRHFNSEYEVRVAVAEHAVEKIIQNGRANRTKNEPMYHPDSVMF